MDSDNYSIIERFQRLVLLGDVTRIFRDILNLRPWENTRESFILALMGVEQSVQILEDHYNPDGNFSYERDTPNPHQEHRRFNICERAFELMESSNRNVPDRRPIQNMEENPEGNIEENMEVHMEGENDLNGNEEHNQDGLPQMGVPVQENVQNEEGVAADVNFNIDLDYKVEKFGLNALEGNEQDYSYLITGISAVKMMSFKVFILIPKTMPGIKLQERFLNNQHENSSALVFFGYNQSAIDSLKQSAALRASHDVYISTKSFKFNPQNPLERWEHLARLLLLYSILGSCRYQCHGLTITPLVAYRSGSILQCAINELLLGQIENVLEEIQYVIENPNSLLCIHCSEDCPHHGRYWHLDLQNFSRHGFPRVDIETDVFLDSHMFLFGHEISPEIALLQQRYLENRECSFEVTSGILNELQQLFLNKEPVQYCTYFLLFVDDCNDGEIHINKILQNPETVKYLYVGHTKDADFRKSLFKEDGWVTGLMNACTKALLLRNYISNDFLSVIYDEAYLFVLINSIRDCVFHSKGRHDVQVVNKYSMAYGISGCRPSVYGSIVEFVENMDEQGIWDPFNENQTIEGPATFNGNCGMKDVTDDVRRLVTLQPLQASNRTRAEIKAANLLKSGKKVENWFPIDPVIEYPVVDLEEIDENDQPE